MAFANTKNITALVEGLDGCRFGGRTLGVRFAKEGVEAGGGERERERGKTKDKERRGHKHGEGRRREKKEERDDGGRRRKEEEGRKDMPLVVDGSSRRGR